MESGVAFLYTLIDGPFCRLLRQDFEEFGNTVRRFDLISVRKK